MSIVVATDSDGVEHHIWAQRQAASCAVACLWMACSLVRQMSFAEGEWDLAWRLYRHIGNADALREPRAGAAPGGPMALDPNHPARRNNQNSFANMFARFGTLATQVTSLLGSEGIRVTAVPAQWQAPRLAGGALQGGSAVDPARLGQRQPAIVLIGWYRLVGGFTPVGGGMGGELRRNGGHFVTAVRRSSAGNIVYRDPWGGVLRERGPDRRYGRNGIIEQVLYLSPQR